MTILTTKYNGQETTEVIGWQGMLVQASYNAAKEQVQKFVPDGVYVACCLYGSPAQSSFNPGVWITELDQVPIKTLAQFLTAVSPESINERKATKLQTQNSSNTTIPKGQEKNALALLALPTKEEMDDMLSFKDESHIQVKYMTRDNVTHVATLKMDKHYWPTWHIIKNKASLHGWDLTFAS